jgi:hypothetical protein
MDKITQAQDFVDRILQSHKNPAILCSFGKDSILMTYIALTVNPRLPVVFFRHSYNRVEQYAYADMMIQWFGQKFNPTIIQGLLPSQVDLIYHNGNLDFIEHYPMGTKSIMVPVGIIQDDKSICAKDKILNQMHGSYEWPFDVLLCGHKACDEDALVDGGKIPISIDYLQVDGCSSMAYPIKDFTHQEIFESIVSLGIPVDFERYENVDGTWKEKTDKTKNGDWTSACMNCLDPRNEKHVFCPKLGLEVNNISMNHLVRNQVNDMDYMKG